LNTALFSGKKHKKIVSNPVKTGCVGGQIWSDHQQNFAEVRFSKLTSPAKKGRLGTRK